MNTSRTAWSTLSVSPLTRLAISTRVIARTKPFWQLLRGGYYPSFGKPDDGLGFAHRGRSVPRLDGHRRRRLLRRRHVSEDHRDNAYVGDVVTNRVNEFRLDLEGNHADCDEAGFPAQRRSMVPAGAGQIGAGRRLYIADFYNRIIGHYEVPLDNPGRDHTRGRIWHIVYCGSDGRGPIPPPLHADWTKKNVAELMKDLGNANLAVRFKATNELTLRGGKDAVAAVMGVMKRKDKPEAGDTWRRMHGLWVLERLGTLDDATLTAAVKDKEFGVRVHAQRVLAERTKWTDGEHALATAGLKDADPNVQRAAADGVGRHPAGDNLRSLLELEYKVPAGDTHLLFVVRMALRNQLLDAAVWKAIPLKDWTERDAHAIADVSLGAPNPESATFLLKHLAQHPEPRGLLVKAVHHIARYGNPETLKAVTPFARGQHAEDLGLQNDLFKAVRNGVQERGAKLDEADRRWAGELTDKLLASKQPGEVKSGVELVGALKLENEEKKVSELALNKTAPREQREAAWPRCRRSTPAVTPRCWVASSPRRAPSSCAKRPPSCWVKEINQKHGRSFCNRCRRPRRGSRRQSPRDWPAVPQARTSCSTRWRPAKRRLGCSRRRRSKRR